MVSVIIPVYNGEGYIKQCLDSIFCSENVEVVAVNDGSRDASSEILHTYSEGQPRLKVIDKENAGAAQARLTGLSAASGDFVAFVDVDDRVAPKLYERLEAKAQDGGCDAVFFDYVSEYPEKSVNVKSRFFDGQEFPMDGRTAIKYMNRREAVFSFPWNKIFRKSLFEGVVFPQKNFVGEDYYMNLQLFEKTDKIDYLDIIGYHYVMTENSASRGGYGASTLVAYENYKKLYAECCERNPERIEETTDYLTTEYMSFVIAMGRNNTYNAEMLREIKAFVRNNLWHFVKASYVPLVMKGSAMALCISHKLLIFTYKLIN